MDFMRHSGRRLIVIERRIETGSDRTDRPDRHPDDASDANDGSSPSESTDCRLILFDEAVSHGSSVARCPDCQGLIAKGEKALFCSRCDFEEAEVG